ncbi:MarR family winged helix-turn-helix transcriptional regulator [Gordonia soli]|uniref:Putative MarR family transcriptional regulator n=1 Tax=Gordonia soli NBRC 108243 TaxID=1223545 RepID=M0QFW9_9ACTN|nr:MarR family transcriptional regulator [Gordonia soli]GAC67510.1 putative MarR family transcriptional regulator [Gordonia soli NBRC 108243]
MGQGLADAPTSARTSAPTAASQEPTTLHRAAAVHHDLIRISRAIRTQAGERALSAGQMSALWTIVQHAPIRATELADRERVAAPTMSRVVASLERLGMATRTTDANDGRVSLLTPTDDGRAYIEGTSSRKSELFAQALDRLADADRNGVERAMRLLADTLCELTPRPSNGACAGEMPPDTGAAPNTTTAGAQPTSTEGEGD